MARPAFINSGARYGATNSSRWARRPGRGPIASHARDLTVARAVRQGIDFTDFSEKWREEEFYSCLQFLQFKFFSLLYREFHYFLIQNLPHCIGSMKFSINFRSLWKQHTVNILSNLISSFYLVSREFLKGSFTLSGQVSGSSPGCTREPRSWHGRTDIF